MPSTLQSYGTKMRLVPLLLILLCCAAFAEDTLENTQLPSESEARQRARILHEAMHATLQFVHHEYYREDEGLPLPAATLKDVFKEVEKEHQIQMKWLAVEGQTMNTDHEANTDFEKAAVRALKSGDNEYEQVEGDLYRHVGAIALTNHCLKCHVPDRKSTENRKAGLSISIPIRGHSQAGK